MDSDLSLQNSFKSIDCSSEQLLNNLQLHQVDLEFKLIELEIQNEHLRSIQTQHDESEGYYADLFNNAPVAYLTLNDKGLISEVNLAAAKLFGMDLQDLLSRRFASLVTAQDSDYWYLFYRGLKESNTTTYINLSLKGCGDTEVSVRLDCLLRNSMLRITLNDLTTTKVTPDASSAELLLTARMDREKILNEELTRLQKIAESSSEVFFHFCFRPDGSVYFPYISCAAYNKFRLYLAKSSRESANLF
jgi:hypothetical protein